MSAAHNLAGMFPPKNQQIWNESLLWQAIPIHTMPESIDYILAMKRPCPLYIKAFKEYEQSEEIQWILEHFRELIQYLEMHSGLKLDRIVQIKSLYETLWIENLKNFS